MRVLVLGGHGMLGQDVLAAAPPLDQLVAPTHAQLDITDLEELFQASLKFLPQAIINCAAYTDVDGAERDRERADRVNRQGVQNVVTVMRAGTDNRIVHVSTDYVFDGAARVPYREDAERHPLGAYGASKLAGERVLEASPVEHLIVRTSWLFGAHGRSFPRTMWERATAGKATRVVNDQVGRPTYTVDLARAIWHLEAKRACGTVHVANRGSTTWYGIAQRIFRAAGAEELLEPCTTDEYPTVARRPAYSVLDTTRYDELTGRPLPPWEEAIDRFLDELRAEEPAAEGRK